MNDVKTNSEVFTKNEIKANYYTANAVLITAIIFIIAWVLNLLGVFDVDTGVFTAFAAVTVTLLAVPYVLNRLFKGKKHWLKYTLLGSYVIAVICADAILTYSVTLLAVLPVILSCHYYSKRITVFTACAVALLLGASTVLGTYYGILDLNNAALLPGTVIKIAQSLEEAVLSAPVDYAQTAGNALQYIYLPKLMILAALTPVCYTISTRTRQLISDNDAAVREEARIHTELNVAASIQTAMLPKILPTFPNRPEFDLFASMDAAKEVGGDFYDCFFTDGTQPNQGKQVVIVVADVSGKGIPASMFMVVTKTLLKNKLQSGVPIDMAFNDVNRQICDGNDMNMFVTMWAAVIDLQTGKAEFVNAGHNPPLYKKAGGNFEYLKKTSGMIVGIMDDSTYEKQELTLSSGDVLFLYTDGVTEAMDEAGSQYGEERLQQFVNAHADYPVQSLTTAVSQQVMLHAGAAEQSDDITMLALKWRGQAAR